MKDLRVLKDLTIHGEQPGDNSGDTRDEHAPMHTLYIAGSKAVLRDFDVAIRLFREFQQGLEAFGFRIHGERLQIRVWG